MQPKSIGGLVTVFAGLLLLLATYVATAILVYGQGRSCIHAQLPSDIGNAVNETSARQDPIVFPVGVTCSWDTELGPLSLNIFFPLPTVFVCISVAVVLLGVFLDVRMNRESHVQEFSPELRG